MNLRSICAAITLAMMIFAGAARADENAPVDQQLALLKSEDAKARFEARNELLRMHEQMVAGLLAMIDSQKDDPNPSKEELHRRINSSKRIAIDMLGRMKLTAAIATLSRVIDYEVEPLDGNEWERRYPAMRALIEIGHPATEYLVQQIGSDVRPSELRIADAPSHPDMRLELCVKALIDIEGHDKTAALLDDRVNQTIHQGLVHEAYVKARAIADSNLLGQPDASSNQANH
ncbi:MAG: hypothetical protein GC162_10000 [Planctomycetes bacterium]|nr:hypothetical protein [Planctomycetota bacterium]